jgi:RND family efflux transporter MFP subunit
MTSRWTGAAVCGAMLAVGFGCGSPPLEELETTEAVPVTVARAELERLQAVIAVTGLVTPAPGAQWTIVAPEVARIAELPKAEGDPVSPGDLLVRFDVPSVDADLAARRASVTLAEAHVETTRAAVRRLTGLFEKGIAAGREVEEARRDQAEAEAELAQARSALEASTALAERVVVRATFAGVVARRWHNPGDLVDATTSDPVLRVIDPAHLQVIASVPIADVSRLRAGQAARVIGPGNEAADARVVRRPAEIERGSATADVRLAYAVPTHLVAGTPVRIEIVTDERPEAVVVPAAAVVREGEDTFIYVAGTDDVAHRLAVRLGLASLGKVEVQAGIAAGDLVIVRGQDGLPDGASVTVLK